MRTKLLFWTLVIFLITILAGQAQSLSEYANAFAKVESGGKVYAVGDNGKAWGLYQFHLDRWEEMGGKPEEFGKVGARRQTEVFLNELEFCRRKYIREEWANKGVDFTTALANFHNLGHISDRQTDYVKKIKKKLSFL